MRRLGVLAFVVVMVLSALPAAAQELSVIVAFDPALGELPEAIAIDDNGDIFLSMASGEIKKVTPDGTASTFASLPSPAPDGFVTGLAFGPTGDLFVGLASFDPATHGIWRVAPDGSEELFLALDPATLPNDIIFDSNGDMVVSESFGGQILKVNDAAEMTVWSSDPLLAAAAIEPLPFSVGPNGIAFDQGEANLYVVTTGTGRVLRIPVGADGSAGAAEVVVEDLDLLGGADGMSFDSEGNLYVANFIQDKVLTVTPGGEITTVAEGAPLQNPSDVAFDDAGEALITNFAVLRALGLQEGAPEPALLRLTAAPEPTPTAVPPTAAPTPTTAALPETGVGSSSSGGAPLQVLAALAGAGLLATAGWVAMRRRARAS